MILSVSLSQGSHDKYIVCCVSLLHVDVNSSFDKKTGQCKSVSTLAKHFWVKRLATATVITLRYLTIYLPWSPLVMQHQYKRSYQCHCSHGSHGKHIVCCVSLLHVVSRFLPKIFANVNGPKLTQHFVSQTVPIVKTFLTLRLNSLAY